MATENLKCWIKLKPLNVYEFTQVSHSGHRPLVLECAEKSNIAASQFSSTGLRMVPITSEDIQEVS